MTHRHQLDVMGEQWAGSPIAEGSEMMHRRCLDFVIQKNCILAFQVPNVMVFRIGVKFHSLSKCNT